MKAISLWQPWASLVACKAKMVETRSWATRYRGPLAIHAANRQIDEIGSNLLDEMPLFLLVLMPGWNNQFLGGKGIGPVEVRLEEALPLGAVVARAELVDCKPMGESVPEVIKFIERHKLNEVEVKCGHYGPGRFAWFFKKVEVIFPPSPATGRQGLWEWDEANHTRQPKLI